MATASGNPLTDFHWTVQPEAAQLVAELLQPFVEHSDFVRTLQSQLLTETGTRLADWIDSFALPDDAALRSRLENCGFERHRDVYAHPRGLFPRVRCLTGIIPQLHLKVESVVDFLAAQRLSEIPIEGVPLAPLRRACVDAVDGAQCWVVERHGADGFDIEPFSDTLLAAVLRNRERFRLRRREFDESRDGFAHASALIDAARNELPRDRVCELFFAAERDYWQSRNRAARVQRARQDALGLGWANHDHHTYRSSRAHFADLIALLETLGFECRERFYAGREAGWGAQVLEQPRAGVIVFADVDLSPEEVAGDFAHEPLPPRAELGTVGLWCRLHGEAFLEAGMHHLECQFDFDAAREQLQRDGVGSMKPFTDFAYLRQAFTQGEHWPVRESRLAALLADGSITPAQAETFRTQGALGSHLEILQRNDGYKGFNQTGINEIILATDPRRGG